MNKYKLLIDDLHYKFNKDTNKYLFRISMQSDLERVKKFGSTRIGLSKKIWDKLEQYPNTMFPKYPVLHEDMIIASKWKDLEDDVLLENGTLKHKLEIYNQPFFTVYKSEKLLELGREDSLGTNNQGTHFFFLDNPLNCLDSLWQIHVNEKNEYYIEELKWK